MRIPKTGMDWIVPKPINTIEPLGLITVPLENYIEDVLFRINRPAVIYPRIILSVIRTQLKEGKPKNVVEQVLVEMQKHKEFDKLYEAQKQKM